MIQRCYQDAAHAAVMERFAAGDQRTLVVMATGAGKTVLAGHLAKSLMGSGRILFLAHRDELVRQAFEKLATITGILPSIEMGDERSFEENIHGKPPIVVSSIQTQVSGKGERKRMHRFDPDDFSLCIVDECHHAPAGTYKRVINHYASNKNCKIVGVTATADRADGEGLHQVFQSVAYVYDLPDIIADGYLVPIHQRTVILEGLDLSKCRTTAGDLNQGDLEERVLFEKPLMGVIHATIEHACDLPENSMRPLVALDDQQQRVEQLSEMIELHGNRHRKTLVFAVTVKHAEAMAEIFNRWLPESAAHIECGMSKESRRRTLRRFRDGQIQFLCNCMIATEGFDEPGIELVSVARPTKSRPLFSQMIGRGTRPSADIAATLGTLEDAMARRLCIAGSSKPFVKILDFAGNNGRHRLVNTADLLGGQYEEEVIEAARDRCQGESVDMTEALRDAKEELERKKREAEQRRLEREKKEEERRLAEAARRANVVGVTHYNSEEHDGFDKYGIRINRDAAKPFTPKDPATLGMIRTLISFGVQPETAEGCSKGRAGAMISAYKKKRAPQDWSRANNYRPKPPEEKTPLFPKGVVPSFAHPPGTWQTEKLRRLNYRGEWPKSADKASALIRQLEGQRAGAA